MTLGQHAKSIKWRAIFAESSFICASIFLAFALQDWDEEKDIEERTLIALCNVKAELAFNRVLIKADYLPRQKGMLSLVNSSIEILRNQPETELAANNLERMLLQEPLRYSAWRLAGESGYLLYADFALATEIGALFDFQTDHYQATINRINNAVFDPNTHATNSSLEAYITISSLVREWVAQTEYLQKKYEALFISDDFNGLDCQE
ncbi:hypothetical protein P2G88_11460 [Aliiglaciecola sp. CAU 1673]|uniref:hypothetical protein n=1 Tax=Aliiglaciecola sp. CAU 1673 TaxID=3032595 RepID=UPI0023DB6EF5|nr:hypothetical protein [Aliiglaciecola sp. CAU 1673]MDF2178866.1 hypothetical protein [Aliiglaciecola sp. CAU 1673]